MYIYGVEGLFFYCYFSTAISTIASCQNRAVALAWSLIFGTRSPGVSTTNLDRPLHAGYTSVPGRLRFPFLFPFERLVVLFPTVVCFPGLFPRPIKLYVYIGGYFYLNYPWEGVLALRVFFPYCRCYFTLCIEN